MTPVEFETAISAAMPPGIELLEVLYPEGVTRAVKFKTPDGVSRRPESYVPDDENTIKDFICGMMLSAGWKPTDPQWVSV